MLQAMIARRATIAAEHAQSAFVSESDPADQPVLYMSLNSPTLRLSDVDEYAETLIAQRVSMVSGVAQVQVLAAAEVFGARLARPQGIGQPTGRH